MQIKQQLVTSRAKTYSGINTCKYITIHETANKDKGADAQRHATLQSNGFSASWHYQVDDKQAIQSYPDTVRCWHAGDKTGPGNYSSIGIEICVNSDGDFKKAVANAVELVKVLMARHNIPIGNVVQHNKWSGKNCPTNLRNGSKGVTWSEFIAMVKQPASIKVDTGYSSPALKDETELNLGSKARRQMIVSQAIAAGYNKVWQTKLDDKSITDADLLALGAGTSVRNSMPKVEDEKAK